MKIYQILYLVNLFLAFFTTTNSTTQQGFLGLLHRGEVETIYHLAHQLGDAVVAQVADATFVGVVHFLAGGEAAGLDVETHLLVGVAEGHAFAGQAVDFLDAEDERIAVVVEDVFVHLDRVHDVGGHLQAVFQLLEGRQEDFLDDLQVAEVARGQVVGNHHDLLGQRLDLVALGAGQLEDVGVLLVGHDAGAGGTLVGQLDEAEVLAVEQAGVEGQLGEGAGNGGQGEGDVALHLAAAHLGVDDVIVHGVEAQQAGGHRAVEGEGRAVAGGGAEGIAVAHAEGGLQEHHVVHEALGIGAEPQAEGRGHGNLQMGVAGHEDALVAFALADEHVEELLDGLGDVLDLLAGEELEIEQHLVVARAAAVYLLAHVAQLAGEHELYLRMDVLDAVFDDELAPLGQGVDLLQLGQELLQLGGGEQADTLEHGDVGHGAQHVVLSQVEVHFAVAPHGEALDILVYLY